jgi:hypothetical protein
MLPIIIAIIAGIVGIVSVKYLGSDNIVEKESEVVIEEELHLPQGTIEKEIEEITKKA